MTYLVAVSGGVDSVVLLDMLVRRGHDVIVGHVDHGIRCEESSSDARFVAALAQRYGVPCVSTALHLDVSASEATARDARYKFLLEQAAAHHATLATAHHLDDIVETIVINLERGTGWRGLAVLGRADIVRPLVKFTKQQLYDYAVRHRLEWVEDRTNATDDYQRNRVRHRLPVDFAGRGELGELRVRQLELRNQIVTESWRLVDGANRYSRYFYAQIPTEVGMELLGTVVEEKHGIRPTRPRLERALLAIKTARPGTTIELGQGVNLAFTSRTFLVKGV